MNLFRLWRALTHPWLALALTGVLFIALAAHTALPQTPTTLADDPIARSRWLVETAATLPAGSALNALGLLDIAHNLFLRVLLPLFAVVLLLRLADRLALAQLTRTLQPPLEPAPTTQIDDLSFEQPITPEEGDAFMARWCERWQSEPDAENETRQWHGDRRQRFTWFATLIEVGLGLTLLALLLNARFGWQTETLTLSPGERLSLAPLASITLSIPEENAINPPRVGQAPVQVEGASRFGLLLRQQAIHPGLQVSVTVGERALAVQAIEQGGAPATRLTLRFPQPRSERAVAIPERNLFFRVVNDGPQHFSLQALDASDALLLTQEIEEPVTIEVEDVRIHLRPTYFVALRVAKRPWLWLLIPAALLTLMGFYVRWRLPYLRLGLRTNASGSALRRQAQSFARPTLEEISQAVRGERESASSHSI
ncbi:MAG: hypothetical protein GXP42_09000 [Chloroflexi bacterium]|nr:hypothetical protein [Chloroflexota bacterium]